MISEFIYYLQHTKKMSLLTVQAYQADLVQFEVFIATEYNIDLKNVQQVQIRDFVVHLKSRQNKNSSINRKLSAIKSFYKYGIKNNLIENNPTGNIVNLKQEKRLPVFFKENEVELSVAIADGHDFDVLRSNIIVDLFYETGIRRAELINIKDCDLNFFSLTLRIVGKGNKERVIPISEYLKQKLIEYIKLRDKLFSSTDTLIVSNKGEKTYPNFIYRIVKQKMDGVSTLSKTSPHVLRHTFASALLNNGAEINAVKELLGHASLAATQVYTHTSFKKLKQEYKKAHPRE